MSMATQSQLVVTQPIDLIGCSKSFSGWLFDQSQQADGIVCAGQHLDIWSSKSKLNLPLNNRLAKFSVVNIDAYSHTVH